MDLFVERFGERAHEGFRGTVHGHIGHGLERRRRRNVDHAASAAREHAGQKGVREGDEDVHVHGDLIVFALGLERLEAAVGPEAGVVHEQVDVRAEAGNARSDARRRAGLGQVDDEHVRALGPGGAHADSEFVEPFPAPGDQNQVVAASGQLQGEFVADPRRRAGDEGDGPAHAATGDFSTASTLARMPSS